MLYKWVYLAFLYINIKKKRYTLEHKKYVISSSLLVESKSERASL